MLKYIIFIIMFIIGGGVFLFLVRNVVDDRIVVDFDNKKEITS